jgi:hypothetical protein
MFNVLPVYDDINKQNFRKEICFNDVCTFQLLTTTRRLPPFQFRRPYSLSGVDEIDLYCYDDTLAYSDLLSEIDATEITIENSDANDWITYFGNKDINITLPCGTFYLKITDGDGNIYYTELFTVSDFTDNSVDQLIKIYDSELPVIDINNGTDNLRAN